jgi:hypothetical protein
LLVDYSLLDSVIDAFDRRLHAADAGAGAAAAVVLLRREVLAAVRHTDDCLRKPVLARWLIGSGQGGG